MLASKSMRSLLSRFSFSTSEQQKPRILFVCVANSCRSLLAEVLGRKYLSQFYEVHSAGSSPSKPNALTLEFLTQKGFDISELALHSKAYSDIPKPIDIAIALCDEGDMECASYFDVDTILQRKCWSQRDPVKADGTMDDKMEIMESVWQNIEEKMIDFREQTVADLEAKKNAKTF